MFLWGDLVKQKYSQWKLLLIDKTEKTMGVTKYGYSKKTELKKSLLNLTHIRGTFS
jgi:uncharacterized membrane protein